MQKERSSVEKQGELEELRLKNEGLEKKVKGLMQFLETERLKSINLDVVIQKKVQEKEDAFYEKHVIPLKS